MVKPSSHLLILLLLAVTLTGCDPQTRHKTLTFFFTGVPPLDESHSEDIVNDQVLPPFSIPDQSNTMGQQIFYSHPVWAAGSCSFCHEGTGIYSIPGVKENAAKVFRTGGGMPGKLTRPKKELCIQCHTDKTPMRALTENLWLHNTTAKGDCLACHDPHQSINARSLRQPKAVLCLPCHKEGNYLFTPVHQTEEECLTCHNPHMGLNKNLLTKEYQEVKIKAELVPEPGKIGW